jgi:hypothetical protein
MSNRNNPRGRSQAEQLWDIVTTKPTITFMANKKDEIYISHKLVHEQKIIVTIKSLINGEEFVDVSNVNLLKGKFYFNDTKELCVMLSDNSTSRALNIFIKSNVSGYSFGYGYYLNNEIILAPLKFEQVVKSEFFSEESICRLEMMLNSNSSRIVYVD